MAHPINLNHRGPGQTWVLALALLPIHRWCGPGHWGSGQEGSLGFSPGAHYCMTVGP